MGICFSTIFVVGVFVTPDVDQNCLQRLFVDDIGEKIHNTTVSSDLIIWRQETPERVHEQCTLANSIDTGLHDLLKQNNGSEKEILYIWNI